MPDETSEIEELQQLFGHSEVPRGMFLKYQVSKQNREIADQGRQRKAELAQLMEERKQEQHRRIQNLRNKTKDLDTEAVARHKARNQQLAREVKQAEQAWERSVMQQRTELKRQVRNRGSADFHNARLAEKEAELDRKRREKASTEHQAYLKKMRETHAQRMHTRQTNANKTRGEVEAANTGSVVKAKQMRQELADEAKEAKRLWKEQFEKNEKARMDRARANRKHAEEVRERARQNKQAQTNNRISAGNKMQKEVDAQAAKAKADLIAYKKGLRQERYKARYASDAEADLLKKSTFRRLYGLGATEDLPLPDGSPQTSSQVNG